MILTLVIRWSKSKFFFDISLKKKKMIVKGNRRILSFSSYSSVWELSYKIVSDELRSFENLLHVIFRESTIIQLAVGVELRSGISIITYTYCILRLVSLILFLTDLLLDVFLVGIVKSRCWLEFIDVSQNFRSSLTDCHSRWDVISDTKWNPNTGAERHTGCKRTTRCPSSEILSYTIFWIIHSKLCVCPF